jgi:DNA-binding response OmpR family regulator
MGVRPHQLVSQGEDAINMKLHVDLPSFDVAEASRVLVVDDDEVLRELIAATLEGAGLEVTTAAGGLAALAMIEHRLPHLVVLDVMMPDLSGMEVCRRLRTAARTEHIPIIMLTARVHVRDESEGLMAGADLYLAKPFSPRTLLAKVQTLLAG